MNESDARRTLLIRAFETAAPSPQWDDEDRDWATRSAAQIEGEQSTPERFVARRAGLASERLAGRVPAVARLLAALHWRPWLVAAIAAAAFLAGLVLDTISAGNRINILAPPILAILLWNFAVYLALAVGALRGWLRRRSSGPAANASGPAANASGPAANASGPAANASGAAANASGAAANRSADGAAETPASGPVRWLAARLAGLPRQALRETEGMRTPIAAFTRHWALASGALNGARGIAGLHVAAAMLALGLLASLYLRGLAFEFLAGWESTFLTAPTVAALLQVVLGPASALTGIALPDVARLEAIRLPAHPGENAAGWIHLYAATLVVGVVLPRLALAAVAGWRARRLARDFPLPLADPYYADLLRQYRGEAAVVRVLPYSYQVPVDAVRALNRLMQAVYGPSTTVTIAAPVQLGAEDRLRDSLRPPAGATLTIALFSLTATPEAENHATFVRLLRETLPDGAPLLVLVDESGFRARFGAGSERLATRRSAWRRILASGADLEPFFVALGSDDPAALKPRLGEVLHRATSRMVQNHGLTADVRAPA